MQSVHWKKFGSKVRVSFVSRAYKTDSYPLQKGRLFGAYKVRARPFDTELILTRTSQVSDGVHQGSRNVNINLPKTETLL